MAGLFNSIAKRLVKVAFSFREKPTAKLDDYVLEHFLLYHGLVGSSPENQRSFKDVRADIFEALEAGSSLQLAIAMKVQPLWWDDKLKAIFAEAPHKKNAPELLLPKVEDESWPNQSDPLGHPEWMVRANAANMLAHLKVSQADDRMIRALDDTVGNGSAAFCHIAYALGKLGSEKAKDALTRHINTEEPWFRVDVAGALAASSREDIYEELAQCLFSNHALLDYTSVAIAKHRKPFQFLDNSSVSVQDAGCALIIGLLQASKQAFASELTEDLKLPELLSKIEKLADANPTAIRIHAAILLAEWTDLQKQFGGGGISAEAQRIREHFSNEKTQSMLISVLEASADQNSWEGCNQRHAIQLAGELQAHSALPILIAMLTRQSTSIELVIQALEDLGDESATTPLVALANQLVDVKERANLPPSKNPVQEEKEYETKLYWQILKALGNLPAPNTMALLMVATNDYAPDKREQALASLISGYEQNNSLLSKTTVNEVLKKGLADASTSVKNIALDGVARLAAIDLSEQVLELFDAKEISVAKQAKQTLTALSMQGHEGKIESELKAKLQKENDQHKRKALTEFINNEPK